MIKNKKGQVTIEFILMFIVCASFLIYITYFSFSLTNLQYKEYVAFMIGRTISASAVNYQSKKQNALSLKDMYESTSAGSANITSSLDCTINTNNGFRKILDYGAEVSYDAVSITGVACRTTLNNILPSMRPLNVAIELMTGSEITDKHCNCSLKFDNSGSWKTCLNESESGSDDKGLIDNGC